MKSSPVRNLSRAIAIIFGFLSRFSAEFATGRTATAQAPRYQNLPDSDRTISFPSCWNFARASGSMVLCLTLLPPCPILKPEKWQNTTALRNANQILPLRNAELHRDGAILRVREDICGITERASAFCISPPKTCRSGNHPRADIRDGDTVGHSYPISKSLNLPRAFAVSKNCFPDP